jgi:large subunit ribosomal protein L49
VTKTDINYIEMASQCFTKHLLRVLKPRFHTQTVLQLRNSSDLGSKVIGALSQYTDVEVTKNPEEWKFVERLLPPKYVPEPSVKEFYPSGWRPMEASSLKLPFFVKRSRNHMPPIYLEIQFRGTRRFTVLKNIQGDIQALHEDLHKFIQKNHKERCTVSVNEMQAQVLIKGDFVALVQKWFDEKGF